MSKPVSFGFSAGGFKNSKSSKPFAPTKRAKATLRDEHSDDNSDDDAPPKHEKLSGFDASGAAISSKQASEKEKGPRVIENAGNQDWRRRGRGKNLLPAEVQAAQKGKLIAVEKDEVSTKYGLQFAEKDPAQENGDAVQKQNDSTASKAQEQEQAPRVKNMTDDERALQALLGDDSARTPSTAVIDVRANDAWQQQRTEAEDFQADVSSRPDSSTLAEYDAMPVEEFGMAMLRGMGKKRRANGEVINFNVGTDDKPGKADKRQMGFLGIGAKPVKGIEVVELGAWGKADMRKNAKGEGFFMPLMVEDKRTGERITEEELERRRKEAKGRPSSSGATNGKRRDEDEWRDRRDRNLEKSGRDRDRDRDDGRNGDGGSRKRDRDERDSTSSRSKRDRADRDRDYDSSSRSKRDRRIDEDDGDRDSRRDKNKDRRRDKHRDDDRYESSSSKRSEQRHRDRDRNRDRERDRDDRRHRDGR